MAQARSAARKRSAGGGKGGKANARKAGRTTAAGKSRLLPEAAAALVRKRILQLAGIGVVIVAAVILATLFSYHAGDPSWSATGTDRAANWLGRPGSHVADILFQFFGLAVFVLPLVMLVWGARLIAAQQVRSVLWRLSLLPAVMVLLAMLVAAPAPEAAWPAPTGPGGLIGGYLHSGARTLIEASGWSVGLWPIHAAAALIALAFLLMVAGISLREWRIAGAAAWRALRWTAMLAGRWRPKTDGAERRPGREAGEAAAALAGRAAARAEDRAAKRRTAAEKAEAPKPAKSAPAPAGKSGTAKQGGLVEESAAPPRPGKRTESSRQPRLALENENFEYPPIELLQKPPAVSTEHDTVALEQNARYLETVLQDFGVKGQIVKVRPGPVVTLYELEPAPGVKAARIINLADDIARSMSAVSARIAVIPGRSVIGIELPNSSRETVYLRELLASEPFERTGAKLPLVLGKDIGGQPVIADLGRMPHLLIAGTTGSGKSVGINTMILSMLYTLPPSRCRFIMVDPKMLELSMYDDIPHLLSPVVTDPKKAVVALRWTVREMEGRYQAMSKLGVRNLDGYNARIEQALRKGETLTEKAQTGTDEEGRPVYEERPIPLEPLPHIVVIVDEMADLMMVAGKDIEAAVQRLAQMARAAGIHLIMATQRPSVDVITGTIKANFPTRVSFQVTSKIDSRTILGEQGAEQLLGQGDMLYMAGGGRITRVHGPFVSDDEVDKVVAHLRAQGEPRYVEDVTSEENAGMGDMFSAEEGGDELFSQAVQIVLDEGKASTSFIQRKLQIGYNRAARIMEQMEEEGIVSPANHAGKREILVDHA